MSDPAATHGTKKGQTQPSGGEVQPLIDQMAKVATHFVSVQSDLAKKYLQHWPGNVWGAPVSGEDLWVAWIDTLGDVAQAWFTWVQMFDVIAGSGWAKSSSQAAAPGTVSKDFTIPGSYVGDIALSSLQEPGSPAHKIDKNITLSPTHITAAHRKVTVTVTPPPNTHLGEYVGAIVDANQNELMQIDMLIGFEY
jgi:hypothetical protein